MQRAEIDSWISYHGRAARTMTVERTALESALIPVTAYILVSAVESYRRYPELMGAIAAASPPDVLGAVGHRPGNQIDAVHLWSIYNIPTIARQIMAPFGLVDAQTDESTMDAITSFWEEAAAAFRGDGTHQATDAAPRKVRPYGNDVTDALLADCKPVDDGDARSRLGRVNAVLTSFCFLLYFDTRAGYQDTGPYELPDGRLLLVRQFSRIGVSHFPWSAATCSEIPYDNVTVALVLDGIRGMEVTDWGTSITDPADYLPHVEAAGVFATANDGTLQPLGTSEVDELAAQVKSAQRSLYRLIAGMSRTEKIDAGAYVYFTFLRPFAEVAGVAEQLDWTVPRDSLDLYDGLSTIERSPDVSADESVPYYLPLVS